jgi:hypothetical protein
MSDDPGDIGVQAPSSQHHAVRVWSVQAPSQQILTDRVALVLGEHMADGDAVIQNGSEEHVRPRLLREPQLHTDLYFEYSALIVLRSAGVV